MADLGTELFVFLFVFFFFAAEMGEGPSEEGGPVDKEPGKN